MDMVFAIILTAVITVGVCSAVMVIVKSRKSGDKSIPWGKVRPIVSEMFVEAMKLMKARDLGYQAVEDYAVHFIREKVVEADFLMPEEKQLLTEEFIRSIVGPRLRELYSEEKAKA